MADYTQLWWTLDDAKARAGALTNTIDVLERTESERRLRCLRNVRLYEGRMLGGLYPSAYFTSAELSSDGFDALRINLARSLVQTAMAKIAGKQRPKAQFVVTDADWSIKRKARWLERFVEAVQLQRQGNLHDCWEVGLLAFRDCCVVDCGILKYSADNVARQVLIERVLPWEIYIDPQEARYGQPSNLFHVYAYDRYKLAEQFPKFKAQIMAAPAVDEDTHGAEMYGMRSEVARMVKVREAWRLPPSPDKPGRHSIVVGQTDLTGGEDYTRSFFPFEFMVWESPIIGMLGTSLVDNVAHITEELNASFQRWSEAERLCSNAVTFYQEGSVREEDLTDNRIGIAIPFTPGASPPVFVAPNSVGEASIQWQSVVKALGYEMSGVSAMAATGQTDQGVTAAIAMRTQENIATERFAIQYQMFERVLAIGSARQIIACVRELDDGEDISVKWPGGGFLKQLKWSDVSLEEDQYTISVYAVSGLVNTPADRLELASELFDRKVLSQEGFLRVIQAKDIDSELSKNNTQSALIERYIETWLDATPDDEEDGAFKYWPPIPFMTLEDAIVQVGRAFMQAQLDDAPEYNQQFFLRYMGDCDALIQRKALQAAQLQAAAKGSGPGPTQGQAPQQGAAPPNG